MFQQLYLLVTTGIHTWNISSVLKNDILYLNSYWTKTKYRNQCKLINNSLNITEVTSVRSIKKLLQWVLLFEKITCPLWTGSPKKSLLLGALSKFRGSDQTQYERIRAPGFGEVITPSLTGPDRGGERYSERERKGRQIQRWLGKGGRYYSSGRLSEADGWLSEGDGSLSEGDGWLSEGDGWLCELRWLSEWYEWISEGDGWLNEGGGCQS